MKASHCICLFCTVFILFLKMLLFSYSTYYSLEPTIIDLDLLSGVYNFLLIWFVIALEFVIEFGECLYSLPSKLAVFT